MSSELPTPIFDALISSRAFPKVSVSIAHGADGVVRFWCSAVGPVGTPFVIQKGQAVDFDLVVDSKFEALVRVSARRSVQ